MLFFFAPLWWMVVVGRWSLDLLHLHFFVVMVKGEREEDDESGHE
jgi:hypothetical protein